ncbi:hypothetical protein KEM55_005489 [Ascosphaera atra]|nr:hypothetical protein KEM55_005489 [Ascosphaera atra]
MIILCNCCGQHELSQKIVMAAAANGIDWYQGFTPRDIRLSVRLAVSQWKLAIEKSRETAFLSKPLGECYYDFARAIEADVRRAADAEVVDHSTKEREQREKQEEDSFRVRLAEKTMKGEKQNDAQEPASQNPQEPPPKPVKTNSETKPLDPSLQRNMDYVTYSLKVSDMSINDLKMELDMESRRAQLAELKSQLATLKQSVHV